MKRNLVIVVVIFISTIVLMLFSDIITIGEKIAHITNVWQMEYVFYLFIFILLSYFVLWPIIKVYNAPQLPVLFVDNDANKKELYLFGKVLARNCNYIKNSKERKCHIQMLSSDLAQFAGDIDNLKAIVEDEIQLRLEGDKARKIIGINERIKEWAKTVFLVTAVSQNGKLDTLAALVLNFKMIEDIILATGFRPTTPQLFKLYVNILITSLVTYCASSVFSDMDDVEPLDFLDNSNVDDMVAEEIHEGGFLTNLIGALGKLRIPGMIFGSALDGATNALMTLRLGFVTRHYMIYGIANTKGQRRKIKREAMIDSLKVLPFIIKDSTSVVGKNVADRVLKFYKFI